MVRILKENQRAAVFRLGRFSHVVGPGIVLPIPFIDQVCVVDLDAAVIGWRTSASAELAKIVEHLTKRYPKIPTDLSLKEIRDEMLEDEERPRHGY